MTRLSLSLLLAPLVAMVAAFAFTQWKAQRISAAHPPAGRFVDVEGASIHYVVTAPQGSLAGTVALVHGASGNESDLRLPLGDLLTARGFRVISLDRPGHGWSQRSEDSSSPALQARQIRQALEKIGVRQAIVAGHSLAGALTLQLALDHSDLVQGVVLIAPVTHPWPGGIAAYYNLTAAPLIGPLFSHTVMTPIALTMFDASLANVFSPQPPPPGYRLKSGVELVLRPQTFRANALDVAGMHDFVSREHGRYGEIAVPVDIATGDSDTIVLTHIHSYGSARDIPGATLHVMKGVGHSPHWARPHEVVERIAGLAQRVDQQRSAGR